MRRKRHGGGGGSRTIIVAWLRVILPLAALLVLSTLFLFSGRPDPEAALPYAEIDPASLAGDPVITAPRWAGVTPDGAKIGLAADQAGTSKQGDIDIKAMRLEWTGPQGTSATATAPQAAMDTDRIILSGGVDVQTSTGWTLHATEVSASRDRSEVRADGGVEATAPLGRLTADTARLHNPAPENSNADSDNADEILDFTGNVRLIYHP